MHNSIPYQEAQFRMTNTHQNLITPKEMSLATISINSIQESSSNLFRVSDKVSLKLQTYWVTISPVLRIEGIQDKDLSLLNETTILQEIIKLDN